MLKQLPIYHLDIDMNDEETGVQIISLVENPAMEVLAVKFEAEKLRVSLAKDAMKQQMTSVVMVPDKPIYRRDADGSEYYVQYSREAIEKTSYKFFSKTGNLKLSNANHNQNQPVDIQVIESWRKHSETDTREVALGLDEQPVGTWFVTVQVLDSDFWESQVMTGNVNGFSLEGLFKTGPKPAQLSTQQVEERELTFEDVLNELEAMLKMEGSTDHV